MTSVLHCIIGGRSYDIPMQDLDIGDASTDEQIKAAVAQHLEQPLSKLSVMTVDRNLETGDITIRPDAVFGAVATEQDQRVAILNSFMTTPHRDLHKIYETHKQVCENDPLFYQQLAAWGLKNIEIRDHKEMFVICLCLSTFDGHRDIGLAILRELPPYQVVRVLDFIGGKMVKETTKTKVGKKFNYTVTTKRFGLFKNLPRSMRTEVERYLRDRENDIQWFDSSALTAKKHMKRLYALCNVKPSDRAQAILFEDKPPEDSVSAMVKSLAKLTEPSEQAKLIMDKKIPYRIACSVVNSMTPTVLFALIDVMSDQELINNIGSLKDRGVFDNADLKAKVEERLNKAKKGKKVAALKSIEAVKAAGVSEDLARQLEDVANAQLNKKGQITRSTALMVDKSSSLSQAIEVAKRLGSAVSAITKAPLYVYAFDAMSYNIKIPATPDFAAWEKAFSGVKSGGQTSCGAPLVHLLRQKEDVEQIVMVTDGEENNRPLFLQSFLEYQKYVNHPVRIVFIKVGNAARPNKMLLEQQCDAAKVEYESIIFNGDYYSIPSMIPFLTKASRLDLLMEIMDYKLPVRKAG